MAMKLYVDLDLRTLVLTAGYTSPVTELQVRKGEIAQIEVRFVRDGVVIDNGNVSPLVTVATKNQFSQDPLLAQTTLTKSGTGANTVYSGSLSLTSNGILGLVGGDPYGMAMLEITWTDANYTHAIPAVDLRIQNSIGLNANVSPLAPAQTTTTFLPGITSLTGGGVNSLDGLITAGLSVPRLYIVSLNTSSQLWSLVSGSEAEDVAGGIVRPDDFNASTNAKVFKRIG